MFQYIPFIVFVTKQKNFPEEYYQIQTTRNYFCIMY